MKDILKLGAILFLITAICTGILGAIHEITLPIIEQNSVGAEKAAMQELLPDADTFEEVECTDERVTKLTKATQNGELIGYIANTAPNGYGGAIELLVGLDGEVNVKGIKILSHAETPGFGANAEKPAFKDQFIDRQTPLNLVKTTPGDGDIQALTGATITSTAIVDGVNDVADCVREREGK